MQPPITLDGYEKRKWMRVLYTVLYADQKIARHEQQLLDLMNSLFSLTEADYQRERYGIEDLDGMAEAINSIRDLRARFYLLAIIRDLCAVEISQAGTGKRSDNLNKIEPIYLGLKERVHLEPTP